VAVASRKRKRRKTRGRLTVADAAELLGSSRQMIYGWIKRGHVPARREGRLLILQYADLKAYLDVLRRAHLEAERIKAGRLTDEEFMQRMFDNDPD